MLRERFFYVALDEYERGALLHSLVDERNELIRQGKYTDAVDDLIVKIGNAPTRKIKVIERDR